MKSTDFKGWLLLLIDIYNYLNIRTHHYMFRYTKDCNYFFETEGFNIKEKIARLRK